jgi:DNA-binding beta-propeller fold protein YncE
MGNANGQFEQPTRLAIDSSGNVYVADYGNNRIQKFTSGCTSYFCQFAASGVKNC